jgi:multicomponent Na+:H+ antiporter subunit D
MFATTVALVVAALTIGVIPGTTDAAQSAAQRFVDGPSYASTVIDGAAPSTIDSLPPYSPPLHAYIYATLTLVAAIGFAALALFGHRLRAPGARRLERLGRRAIDPLHALHSGHVGDYVAWLVTGVALLGGAFAIALS